MKANFKISKSRKHVAKDTINNKNDDSTNLSKSEFEEFISKSGAVGSFMIFRSSKKEEELGLDEL